MANNRNELNKNLAQMLKGGVIMDVTTPEQARIAQDAGACAVMALERIPADIRAAGGVSRMSDPAMIKGIQEAVSIPVMAKVRIGHSPRRAFCRPSKSTISTNPKCSARPMTCITSIRISSTCHSCAVRRIWVKRCDVSPRAHP